MNLVQITSEPDFLGHRFHIHWSIWRYFEYKREKAEADTRINFDHYSDLLYSPKTWWKAMMPGKETLVKSLRDPLFWIAPAQNAPGKSFIQRLFFRAVCPDVLNEYVRRNAVILPFEVVATARSLQVRSTWLMTMWQVMEGVFILAMVLVVWLKLELSVLAALVALMSVCFSLGMLIFVPHLLNYYQFLKRYMD